jgi:hypothetical protein
LLLLPVLRVHFLEISFSTLSSKANVSGYIIFRQLTVQSCFFIWFTTIHF